jgi:hypothetical protein
MRKFLILAGVASVMALAGGSASAAGKKPAEAQAEGGTHPRSTYYRKAPQVRGFVQRRGGYSYSKSDVINTYSDNRTRGANNSYRDSYVDRQTTAGPFDHGFFFDSGISFGRPSHSPYPN